jgi:hypothetical protein
MDGEKSFLTSRAHNRSFHKSGRNFNDYSVIEEPGHTGENIKNKNIGQSEI